jgi:hypothetical protein
MAHKTTFVIEVWTSEPLDPVKDPFTVGQIAAGRNSGIGALGRVVAQTDMPLTVTQSREMIESFGENPDHWG